MNLTSHFHVLTVQISLAKERKRRENRENSEAPEYQENRKSDNALFL